MAIPIIIDTDPGIDDALAIMLAAASPEVEILGITTVGGNTGIDNTTGNALRLAHLLALDHVPVGRGAGVPLVFADARANVKVHGEAGLGTVTLPDAPRTEDARPAVELLRDLIEGSPEPVTVVPIGPLTNIALLAAQYPATYAKIGRIVLMGGGARELGNSTPAAEFNIWFDPEAAARVFQAGVEIVQVGLDVTHKALIPASEWEVLRGGGAVARAALGMLDYYGAFYKSVYDLDVTSQHDSLALAAVIDPTLITTQHCHVAVECHGSLTRGMTVADLKNSWHLEPNTHVALDVDVERFTRLLVGRIGELDSRLG